MESAGRGLAEAWQVGRSVQALAFTLVIIIVDVGKQLTYAASGWS